MADIALRPATADDADQRAYLAQHLVLERVRVVVVDGVDVGRLDLEEGDDEIFPSGVPVVPATRFHRGVAGRRGTRGPDPDGGRVKALAAREDPRRSR
jgi:hypothetical protein